MDDSLPQKHQDLLLKPKPLSSFVKGGVGLMTTALVDMLVAFSTAYWATWSNRGGDMVQYGGYGLWKMWRCTSDEHDPTEEELHRKMISLEGTSGCSVRMADLKYPGWYVTTQVLMTLGLAGLLTSLIMLLLYMFLPQWHRNKTAMSTLIAISYLSGLFIIVGLFIFGFKVAEEIEEQGHEDWFLSWSFSLACTAFVLNQIAASILVTENKRLHKEDLAEENEREKLYSVRGLKNELKAVLTDRSCASM